MSIVAAFDGHRDPMYNQVQPNQQPRINDSLDHPSELHRIIPTLRPDPLAILVKQPRYRQHSHRDEAEQTCRPAHSKPLIHLESEQRKRSTKRVPRHTVRCHRRSTVQRPVSVDEVQCSAEEDAQIAPGKGDTGEHG